MKCLNGIAQGQVAKPLLTHTSGFGSLPQVAFIIKKRLLKKLFFSKWVPF